MTKQDIMIKDVTVIGSGPAGTCAAIQAARAGADTLLIEKNGICGGTTTVGGVNFPGLFHGPEGQVISGIGWELASECAEMCGTEMPKFEEFGKERHSRYQVSVDKAIYSALIDEKLLEAGAKVLFHAIPAEIHHDGEFWRITVCLKEGLREIKSKVLIDCSGDANAVSLAGLPVTIPETVQPATLIYRLGGYDPSTLDMDLINNRFNEEVAKGNLKANDAGWDENTCKINGWLNGRGCNAPHTPDFNARTSEGKTQLEMEARASLLRLFRFAKKQPGLENIQVNYMATECGVRETCVIDGEKTVTVEDYKSGKVWDDSLSNSYYPIDLHIMDNGGLLIEPLADNTLPSIPLGAMRPKNSKNLLVAGRCISSDRLANSALRVQASCMAMGQAVGMTAAMAVQNNQDLDSLDPAEIRENLVKHGAIVPKV